MKSRALPSVAETDKSLPAKWALLLVLLSVFVFIPGGLFQYSLPKIAALSIAVALGLLVSSGARLHPAAAWTGGAVLLVFTASAVRVGGFGPEFWGRWPRYEGVPVVLVYVLLLAAGARMLGRDCGGLRSWWKLCLSLAMVVIAVVALAEGFGARPLGDSPGFRPGAFLGNATDMGVVGLLGCAILLPAGVWKRGRNEVAGAVAGVVTAVASGSRAVLLILLFLVIAVVGHWAMVHWRAARSKTGVAVLVGVVAMIAGLVGALPMVRDRLLSTGTVSGRAELWTATLAMLGQHPLAGVGPGRFVDALPAYQSEVFASTVGTDYPADSPHLIILQWWADGGLLLVCANLALCAAVVWVGVRKLHKAADPHDRLFLSGCLAAIVAFGAVLLTHIPSPGTTGLAGLCAGALAATAARTTSTTVSKLQRQQELQRTMYMGSAAVAGAIGVGAMVGAAAELPLKAGNDAVYQGDLGQATRSFSAAASLRAWDADIKLHAAQAFAGRASAGDPEAGGLAVEWGEQSLLRNPGSVESLLALGVGQLATGDIDDARQTFLKARQLAPANSQILLQSGLTEYTAGNISQAIPFVEKAASLTPDPAEENQILDALRKEASAAGA